MALLELTDISMSYDDANILHDCSICIEQSSSVSLCGPSGVGKSTLLAIMGLLLMPTEGLVMFDGEDVLNCDDNRRAEVRNERLGFIFQSTQLIGSSTVLENVLVPALLGGEGNKEDKARELLCEVGLGDKVYHYPHQLSIGQQRRVSVARALVMEPDIVFADEPTNDLDEANSKTVEDILLGLPDRGVALVLVTHEGVFAQSTERVFDLADSTLVQRQQ